MEEILTCRKASSEMQICSSNIDWSLVMCLKHEIEGHCQKWHFYIQKGTPWLSLKSLSQEKVAKIKNVGTEILWKISFKFVFDTDTISESRGTFFDIRVSFLTMPLYFMLCWELWNCTYFFVNYRLSTIFDLSVDLCLLKFSKNRNLAKNEIRL